MIGNVDVSSELRILGITSLNTVDAAWFGSEWRLNLGIWKFGGTCA
jgi:hypothetical protein